MKKITVKRAVLTIFILFLLPISNAFAGFGFNDEGLSDLLLSYFDLRQRSTTVQVTNASSTEPATIHVQIFSDAFNCEDRDFFDSLTPNETHIYDISNLVSANGNPINFQIPDGSHGFVVISQNNNEENSIIGNFRIIDAVGYEYRVNSAARLNSETFDPHFGRFSDDWGSNLADVVGVRVRAENILPDGTFDLTVDRRTFSLNVYDDEETPISCGEVTLGCDEFADVPDTGEFINLGINDVFPNSRGADVLCSGDFNTDGYFELTVTNAAEVSSISAGFVGLNDGNSIGSMVRFKGFPTMPPES